MKLFANLLLATLAVLAIGAGVFAWQQFQDLEKVRAEWANRDDVASLRKQLWEAKDQLKRLQARLDRLQGKGSTDVASDDGKGDGQGAPKPGDANQGMNMFLALMRNPEWRRLQGIQMAAYFDQTFAPLMKQLNLSPEDAAKFKALALERMQVGQDAYSAAMDQGLDMKKDGKAIQEAVKSATDDVDNQLKAIVGDTDFSSATTYYRTMQPRLEASSLQTSLSYTSSPMTDAQVTQLTQAIASNPTKKDPDSAVGTIPLNGTEPILMKGQQAAATGPMGGTQPVPAISDEAVNAASGFLSQPQVAALKQLQQVQQSQQQLGQIMKATQAAKGN